MLTIDNLIWVCPGLAGMWAYNSVLVVKLPQGEGWKYLLLVVFFALPYYLMTKIFPSEPEYYTWLILLISIPISAVVGGGAALVRNGIIKNRAITFDPFHDSCTSWENKLVFITLKNNKVYLGVLMAHTKVAGFEYTIKIIPAYSGYRDGVGDIHWKYKYPPKSNAFVQMWSSSKK